MCVKVAGGENVGLGCHKLFCHHVRGRGWGRLEKNIW